MLAEGAKAMILHPEGFISLSSALALIDMGDSFRVTTVAVVFSGSFILFIVR
jgi:hypothetical protein